LIYGHVLKPERGSADLLDSYSTLSRRKDTSLYRHSKDYSHRVNLFRPIRERAFCCPKIGGSSLALVDATADDQNTDSRGARQRDCCAPLCLHACDAAFRFFAAALVARIKEWTSRKMAREYICSSLGIINLLALLLVPIARVCGVEPQVPGFLHPYGSSSSPRSLLVLHSWDGFSCSKQGRWRACQHYS